MRDWTWKNWLGLVGVLFAVWLIFYIVEWNSRYGAGKYWGDAFLGWWGDVVMLQWVKSYQTLLAGLLAFGAGAFVYLTARTQRADQIADRNAAVRELRRGHLSEARRLLFAIAETAKYIKAGPSILPGRYGLIDSTAVQQIRDYIAELRPIIGTIGTYAPVVSRTLGAVSERVRVKTESAASATSSMTSDIELYLALSLAGYAAAFLLAEDRLIGPDGSYRHSKVKWERPNEQIDQVLRPFFERT